MIAHFIFFVCYIAIVLIFTYLDFTNEEMTDWIARQFPKMQKAFELLGVED